MELKKFKIEVLPLRRRLLSYAGRFTENAEDAEDVVQEVLLKLWNSRQDLERYRSIEALAMTLTRNVCLDLRRRRRDCVSLESLQVATVENSPEFLLEMQDEVRLVRNIIELLPPLQRTILQMKDIEGYESEQIAQIIDSNVEAVRSNLSRARRRVRDIYWQVIQEQRRRRKRI